MDGVCRTPVHTHAWPCPREHAACVPRRVQQGAPPHARLRAQHRAQQGSGHPLHMCAVNGGERRGCYRPPHSHAGRELNAACLRRGGVRATLHTHAPPLGATPAHAASNNDGRLPIKFQTPPPPSTHPQNTHPPTHPRTPTGPCPPAQRTQCRNAHKGAAAGLRKAVTKKTVRLQPRGVRVLHGLPIARERVLVKGRPVQAEVQQRHGIAALAAARPHSGCGRALVRPVPAALAALGARGGQGLHCAVQHRHLGDLRVWRGWGWGGGWAWVG
jgi:hypothetical protein